MANIESVLEHAQMLYDKEEYEQAYEFLKNNYDQNQNDARFVEKTALAARVTGNDDEAKTYFERLVELDPGNIIGYSELQDIYNHTDRYRYYLTRAKVKTLNSQPDQAIADYKKAVDSTTDEEEKFEAEFLLAKAYEFTGKFTNAIDTYYKSVEKHPKEELFLKIADLYLGQNDKFSAIAVLEKGLTVFKDNDTIKELYARLLLETGELDKAEKYAVSDFLKIKILLSKNENEKAFELLEKFPEKNNPEYLKLSAEYYFNKKDFDKCSEIIDLYAKAAPQNPLVYQMRSMICAQKNDIEGEHINRARMFVSKGANERAMHEFMYAYNKNPENIETIKDIIRLCEATGERHTANEFYEKLITLCPKDEKAYLKVGDFYFDIGEYSTALEYFKKAADFSRNPEIFLKCGKTYEKMKRPGTAKSYYEKYLENAPVGTEAELIKHKLAKLANSGDESGEEEGLLDKIFGFFSKK